MIRFHRSTLLILILVTLASTDQAGAAEIAGLQQMYDGAVLPDVSVATLSHTERLLPVRTVHRGESVRPLRKSAKPFPKMHFEDHGHSFDLYDYLAINRVVGLLILKDDEIALEDYELGIGPDTHWASFSMAKSVASTLVGAALVDGLITSLDDSVSRYVPALRGSAYDGVSVRQVRVVFLGSWTMRRAWLDYSKLLQHPRKAVESAFSSQCGVTNAKVSNGTFRAMHVNACGLEFVGRIDEHGGLVRWREGQRRCGQDRDL